MSLPTTPTHPTPMATPMAAPITAPVAAPVATPFIPAAPQPVPTAHPYQASMHATAPMQMPMMTPVMAPLGTRPIPHPGMPPMPTQTPLTQMQSQQMRLRQLRAQHEAGRGAPQKSGLFLRRKTDRPHTQFLRRKTDRPQAQPPIPAGTPIATAIAAPMAGAVAPVAKAKQSLFNKSFLYGLIAGGLLVFAAITVLKSTAPKKVSHGAIAATQATMPDSHTAQNTQLSQNISEQPAPAIPSDTANIEGSSVSLQTITTPAQTAKTDQSVTFIDHVVSQESRGRKPSM